MRSKLQRTFNAALAVLLTVLLTGGAAAAATPPPGGGSSITDQGAAGNGGAALGGTQFTDIQGNWAELDIETLVSSGVLTVPPDGLFHPDTPVDRLDFAVWIARAEELPPGPTPSFSDWSTVPAEDQPYVAAAVAAGILRGYPDGTFAPYANLPRVQLAVILGRILQRYGERLDTRYLGIFEDSASIPGWAGEASIPIKDALIYGRPGIHLTRFAPFELTTRAETATLILRYLQYRTQHYGTKPLTPPPAPAFLMGFWYTNTDEAYQNLQAHGGQLNWLAYTGYNLGADGSLKGYDSPRTMAWVAANPMPFWFMFQNGWSGDGLLTNPTAEAAAVANILQVAQHAGYSGVNVDVEGVPAQDRAAFTGFIAQLASRLHAAGVKLSVDVPSKTWDDPASTWGGAYDYQALGQLVDYLVLMAYDYHYPGSDPGPVADISWVRRVLDYTTSVIPANKVILGLPAYGYLWSSAGGATAYWESGMENQAQKHGVTPQHDPASEEATYSYTVGGTTYTGWYVDPQGLAARLALARNDHLAGVIAWRLDYDTTDWWPVWR